MSRGRGLWIAAIVLAVLRADLWWWHEPRLVLGLPIGLAYQVGFCLLAAGVMALLARRLLPEA